MCDKWCDLKKKVLKKKLIMNVARNFLKSVIYLHTQTYSRNIYCFAFQKWVDLSDYYE